MVPLSQIQRSRSHLMQICKLFLIGLTHFFPSFEKQLTQLSFNLSKLHCFSSGDQTETCSYYLKLPTSIWNHRRPCVKVPAAPAYDTNCWQVPLLNCFLLKSGKGRSQVTWISYQECAAKVWQRFLQKLRDLPSDQAERWQATGGVDWQPTAWLMDWQACWLTESGSEETMLVLGMWAECVRSGMDCVDWTCLSRLPSCPGVV